MYEEQHQPEHGRGGTYAPRLRPDVVRRERLLDRLAEHPHRMVLVSAPAGFGKTTLVLDWLQAASTPHAWIALDASDDDPQRFFARIAAGLEAAGRQRASGLCSALETQAPPAVLASRLLEDLQAMRHDLLLVFDDYQHIEAPELHRVVAALPERMPEAVRLVVISRLDPPFSLARLRLNGDVLEIRERDLRFTTDEAHAFFTRTAGIALERADAAALERRTEGWIAGLQMAAISLRHEQNVTAFVRTFTGSHVFVVDYLLEEVVQRQTEEMQQFLLRTSILARFDARLCRDVTGRDDAARLLTEAEQSNLFIVSLDGHRAWYRYHHLFAELLSERLRRLRPEEWDRLHERASAWFEAEGDLTQALHHAGAMAAPERLLALLERYGNDMVDRSELAAFAAWAHRIPPSAGAGHPGFLVAHIWVRLLTERFANLEPLLAEAEAAVADTNLPYTDEEKAVFRGTLAIQRAYLLRLQERYEACVAATKDVLAGPAAENVRNRGLLYFNLGRAQAFLGETQAAREAYERAFTCNLQARTWYLVLAVSGYQASLTAQGEGLCVARERLEAALAFAAERRLDEFPASGFFHYQLGRISFLQDDLDGAEAAFEKARGLGETGRVLFVLSNALAGLARVYGVRGAFDAAHVRLRELDVLCRAANPFLYEMTFDVERARLALVEGDEVHLGAWSEAQVARSGEAFTTERESAGLLLMQVWLHQGAFDRAGTVIDWLGAESERRGRRLTHLVVRLGHALLLAGTGRHDAAASLMADVLREAAAQHLVRPFLDGGGAARGLLEQVLERTLARPLAPAAEAHARLLLGRRAAAPEGRLPMFRQPLAEPLTEREQEVLFHLSCGLSYQAIADTLFVSHDTVKTHVKHVYAKLGVAGRREALARAREAGFLLADASRPATPPRRNPAG